jgi:hypothetical protein
MDELFKEKKILEDELEKITRKSTSSAISPREAEILTRLSEIYDILDARTRK